MKPDDIVGIITNHQEERGGLIAILEDIQAKYGWLSPDALRVVADRTGCSLVDLYGVATFYRSFSLEPRGKHLVSVCMGTACHVRGAPIVVEEFERKLDVQAGGTTADRSFTLETVNCLGACALGPIVILDGKYYEHMTAGKLRDLIQKVLKKSKRKVKVL